jgi:hydroxyacylglutathione hydrolase
LALKTDADIYHGKSFDFDYGTPVSTGDVFEFGDLTLKVIETPGHTYESISISVTDRSFGEEAIAVFSSDALFSGDVGRTDFFPDKAEEVAGLLYDSILTAYCPWEIMLSCSRLTVPDPFAAAGNYCDKHSKLV